MNKAGDGNDINDEINFTLLCKRVKNMNFILLRFGFFLGRLPNYNILVNISLSR